MTFHAASRTLLTHANRPPAPLGTFDTVRSMEVLYISVININPTVFLLRAGSSMSAAATALLTITIQSSAAAEVLVLWRQARAHQAAFLVEDTELAGAVTHRLRANRPSDAQARISLRRSNGEEPASPRHRADAASMARRLISLPEAAGTPEGGKVLGRAARRWTQCSRLVRMTQSRLPVSSLLKCTGVLCRCRRRRQVAGRACCGYARRGASRHEGQGGLRGRSRDILVRTA